MKPHGSKERMIDGEAVLNRLRLKNPCNFTLYLKSVWKDLSRRSEGENKGVCRLAFTNYYEVPLLICNRIFDVFDSEGDGYLSYSEFSSGMLSLFNSPLNQLMEVVFHIFDSDSDGFISTEDVHSVFQFIPLQTKHFSHCTFLDRLLSQEEIKKFVVNFFAEKAQLDMLEFKKMTQTEDSTIFLYLAVYLFIAKPFSNSTIKFFQTDFLSTASVGKEPSFIASPTHQSKLIPSLKIIESKTLEEEIEDAIKSGLFQLTSQKSKYLIEETAACDCSASSTCKHSTLSENMNNSHSRSMIHVAPSNHSSNSSLIFSYLSAFTTTKDCSSSSISNHSSSLLNLDDVASKGHPTILSETEDSLIESAKQDTFYEGYMFKLANNKQKRLWFTLNEKYLYCKSL